MKSTIILLAITALAAFVLAGCDQNMSGNTSDVQSTNSSTVGTNVTTGATTNQAATIILPDTSTNAPAGTNK